MKKSLKVSISIICVCVMLITLSAPALAASTKHLSPSASANVSDDHLIQMMENMGYNDADISYIMELEHARRENVSSNPSLNAFPSNPSIGQRHTESYRVYFSDIAVTAPAIAGALVKSGVPAAIAVGASALILNRWQENQDARGVQLSIEYVYGRDNHGGVGWTPGPNSWSLFY